MCRHVLKQKGEEQSAVGRQQGLSNGQQPAQLTSRQSRRRASLSLPRRNGSRVERGGSSQKNAVKPEGP